LRVPFTERQSILVDVFTSASRFVDTRRETVPRATTPHQLIW